MRKGTMLGRGDGRGDSQRAQRSSERRPRGLSSRARLLDVVPIAWLDQLLVAALDLPAVERGAGRGRGARQLPSRRSSRRTRWARASSPSPTRLA